MAQVSRPETNDRPSPNFGKRLCGPVDLLILHYTGMPDDQQALAWLCNPDSEVSAHYFVHRDGSIDRLVSEDHRAWHAGNSAWCGDTDINSRSVGVEIANPGHTVLERDPPQADLIAYPDAQIESLQALCRAICSRHPIPPHRVLAHSDVAPARKRDPGENFPWAQLAGAGIGHWVEPDPPSEFQGLRMGDEGGAVTRLQSLLALYGYRIPVTTRFDLTTLQVVTAFQRHFRPARVDGIADESTLNTLCRLISSLH